MHLDSIAFQDVTTIHKDCPYRIPSECKGMRHPKNKAGRYRHRVYRESIRKV